MYCSGVNVFVVCAYTELTLLEYDYRLYSGPLIYLYIQNNS